MYNKILIPLDGSKLGEAVIPFVDEIILGAKESRIIEVTLLEVVQCNMFILSDDGTSLTVPCLDAEVRHVKTSAMVYLDKIGGSLKKYSKVIVNTLVRVNDDPAAEILGVSDELQIDLIAISTHGRSGMTRWALGSVADRVIRAGTTPVLVIRPKQTQ
jgi:nucleotide-binding universal stress UspA family protein